MTHHRWIMTAVAVTAIVHAIPLAVAYSARGSTLVGSDYTEGQYLALVAAAYRADSNRGASLGNPFLAGHDDAVVYLPSMVERTLAAIAHVTALSPLAVVAISRVAFPAVIALVITMLGASLFSRAAPSAAGNSAAGGALAAILATVVDPRSVVRIFDPHWFYFPRYFRAVSPAAHVLLFLLAIAALDRVRRKGGWWNVAMAGIAIGLLFYTPIFYWTTAVAGAAWFVMRGERTRLMAALAIATVIAIPYFVHSVRIRNDPAFQDTLERRELLTPGRLPDTYDSPALPVFAAGVVALALAFAFLRRSAVLAFLGPFATAATLFTVQNAVTNRHMQSHHWVNCLIPLWAMFAAAVITEKMPKLVPAVFTLGAAAAIIIVSISAFRAQHQAPKLYPLDVMMPATVAWLNANTPPDSVIFCPLPFAAQLPLYTRDKIYWGATADYFVLTNAEVHARESDQWHWRPGKPEKLHYPAGYYLGTAADCAGGAAFTSLKEDTCIMRIP